MQVAHVAAAGRALNKPWEVRRHGGAPYPPPDVRVVACQKRFNCALRVRVHASVEKRVQNLVNRGYSKESARIAIETSDQERKAFVQFAFGVDRADPKLYDLVFNMDKLSVDPVVELILKVARSNEIEVCSVDALRSIEMLALARRAEAALLEAGLSLSHSVTLSVSVTEPGRIELTGAVHDAAREKGRSRC